MAGRRRLPAGSKKSKSEIMKDYRKRNKNKVKKYEDTRNLKRWLQRIKNSLDKHSKVKIKIGPRNVKKKETIKKPVTEITVDHAKSQMEKENSSTSGMEAAEVEASADQLEETSDEENLAEGSQQAMKRKSRYKTRTMFEAKNILELDSDSSSEDLEPPRGQKRKRKDETNENILTKKSRQAEVGEIIRKRNYEALKLKTKDQENEILNLRKSLKEANERSEIDRLEKEIAIENQTKAENQLETRKRKRDFEDSWLKTVYFDLPPPDRKKFKLAVYDNKENLPEGTLSRLRKSTGVNFNKAPACETFSIPPVAEKIREFAVLNSSEKPDLKSNAGGINVKNKPDERFAIHHLSVLHDQYQSDYLEDQCSYRTFTRWWPSYVVKPDLSSRTTCCCRPCENASMKMDALKKYNLLPKSSNIFLALKMEREGDNDLIDSINEVLMHIKDGPQKDTIVIYSKWEDIEVEICEDERKMRIEKGIKNGKKKRPEKRPKSIKVSDFAEKCKQEFLELKSHLQRNYIIKEEVGRKKDTVLKDVECKSALLHVDWSEDIEMQPNREIQSGFFTRKSFSLHSGYVYMYNKSYGFGALATGSNHKAEAIHAAMRPVLNDLLEMGIVKFIFVSDSPVSQYRNCKAVYLLKEWVQANHVSAEWYFTETSHGKSPADGVGGGLKKTLREALQFNSSLTVNCLSDVCQILKTQTGYRVDEFSAEDIKQIKNTLPPRMTPLRGALKIHVLNVDSNGAVQAKCLPSDPAFFSVKTDASFNPRPNNLNRLAPPNITVYPESDAEE